MNNAKEENYERQKKVNGLKIIKQYITKDEEKALIKEIDNMSWSNKIKRRTQHYGYEYDYTSKTALTAAPAFPPLIKKLADRLTTEKIIVNSDQCIVNEYTASQGIAAHIDKNIFGDIIVSISLAGDTNFIFKKNTDTSNKTHARFRIRRRSLMILAGESRSNWTHEIPQNKSYYVKNSGDIVQKKDNYRRISITFRTIKKN